MKKLLCLVVPAVFGIAMLSSCKSGSTTTVIMPYKATYSSSFSLSDNSENTRAVLQELKDWETNKLSNGKSYYGDNVVFQHWSGLTLNLKRDSLLKTFQKYRDSLSTVKIEVAAWINALSIDNDEDWVNVWYKETDTYKNGKVDSAFYEDANQLVKGKIVFTMNQRRNLPKGK